MTIRKPEVIRVSTGSAIVLGLVKGLLKAPPTTVYLLTYTKGKCTANCGFCAQARSSKAREDLLSRVSWPPFPLSEVKRKIASAYSEGRIQRVCIQTLNYEGVLEDVAHILAELKSISDIPVSLSSQPLPKEYMKKLLQAGLERIEVSLDAATEELFDKVKGSGVNGPYRWGSQVKALLEAVEVFGRGKVTTHLIAGLGEKERDMAKTIQWCVDKGILPALFAFTPIPGTRLENLTPPMIESYRKIQVARYLIVKRIIRYEDLMFNEAGEIECFPLPRERLHKILESGEPFITSGCPGCNRPFYNERVSGPVYNVPNKDFWKEIKRVEVERLTRVIRSCSI